MKFASEEINERIAMFSTGKFKDIVSEKTPPCYKLSELDDEIFSGFTRFDVQTSGVTYECVFTPSQQRELYVFLSGASPRPVDLRANFDRISWHQYFNGCCINIEDPTYKLKNVNSGWGGYFGDKQKFYIEGVEDIVKTIQTIYEIANTNVFFISSSAGGFASLHICARNEGYKCLVRNPQIFLGERELDKIGRLSKLDFSQPCYKERLELGDSIVRNKTSKFFMFFNKCSDWDMSNLKQLLDKFGVDDVTRNYYHFGNKHIVVMETHIQEPHNNHCCSFPATIFTRLALYPSDDIEYMLLSFLKANQERCGLQDTVREKDRVILGLRKQLEKKEDEIRKSVARDLCTARLDIKSHGTNNDVEIINLQPNMPVSVTKPAWFKDAAGQGVVVEGSSGYAKLSLHCVGAGLLKLDLRGITKMSAEGKRLPYWITFSSFRINGRELLQHPMDVWHDEPVTCRKKVQHSEDMILEILWHPSSRCLA